MSNYTKERNIITINLDGVNGSYRIDLNTATFYGLRGNPVKTCTHRRQVCNLFYPRYNRQDSQLAYTLYLMIDNNSQTRFYPQYLSALQTAEKLDALNLPCKYWNNQQLEDIGANFKIFLNFLKTLSKEDRDNAVYNYSDFTYYKTITLAKERWGENIIKTFPEDMLRRLVGYNQVLTYSAEEMSVCAYYLIRGKMYEYTGGSIDRLIEYITCCRAMEKTPQKENNFMREYCETKREYELRKTEFDNNRIKINYETQIKALTFEYGDYVVVLPTCGQDLIDEGRNMHHCVGGYVKYIVEGSEFIVFIRHKDTPDHCYLTCQIHSDGSIGQYYLAYDRMITSEADKEFKAAFQKHLKENWVR